MQAVIALGNQNMPLALFYSGVILLSKYMQYIQCHGNVQLWFSQPVFLYLTLK